jgi:hypothetical protein
MYQLGNKKSGKSLRFEIKSIVNNLYLYFEFYFIKHIFSFKKFIIEVGNYFSKEEYYLDTKSKEFRISLRYISIWSKEINYIFLI